MPPISLVIITQNAAASLSACVHSARALVDEVVVVDSGSNDGTPMLAQSLGARVIAQDWLGFGPQKRFAVAAARHDWVLCLDADEQLTPKLAAAIQAELAEPCHHAYRLARRNRFMGRYLRHGEGYPDWCLRLFDRRHANWSEDLVHEAVQTQTTVGTLNGDLLHDSAEDLASYLDKQNRYTSLQAAELASRGKTAGLARLVLSPLARFFKFYLVRRGFLDGLPGLVHICIGCFNGFIKYAKLRELSRQKGQV
ncbi:glycosyltransferase family 2 protein [Parachitinimonas caeni]|uniref:Glycosyltransferase family 2 protein n=1 Tax=Parachitinimonas caeni TaxID=3031301 RepID=A0ABT7DVA3_9NEIS|nr:glycosyltransferase family 2 protein [Parachitinimonas caeni]MDK2123023.1 glycosyltransferase family 2 protein [Parachitinimonas caeni]